MSEELGDIYLESILARYRGMEDLGRKAIEQLSDADVAWQPNVECNSVAHTVKHLRGNMFSRWTEPLTTDGEKSDRNRDGEFEMNGTITRASVLAEWAEGWGCLLSAMESFSADDLAKPIKIRGQVISLLDGINRQIFHVGYHVGQIVQIAKERLGADWKTLSIPRGKSDDYMPTGRLG